MHGIPPAQVDVVIKFITWAKYHCSKQGRLVIRESYYIEQHLMWKDHINEICKAKAFLKRNTASTCYPCNYVAMCPIAILYHQTGYVFRDHDSS